MACIYDYAIQAVNYWEQAKKRDVFPFIWRVIVIAGRCVDTVSQFCTANKYSNLRATVYYAEKMNYYVLALYVGYLSI